MRRILIVLAMLLVTAGAAAPACAGDAWTREALDRVLRRVFINKMADRYIAGAAVSVVKDGRMVYAQGFGRREVFNEMPVEASKTIFRIGSVTKLLTGIAVMQLADAGKIALDDDANRHLRALRVDDAFDAPVRVRNLLTHTAGFDQLGYGRHADSAADVLPLADFLRAMRNHTRPERGGWLAKPCDVTATDDGGIAIDGTQAHPVGDLLFQTSEGTFVVFQVDAGGAVARMLVGHNVFERVP